MTMIAFTASASPSKGYSYADAEEMLDLFGDVLDGRATGKTASRMLEIVGAAQPVTASMRRSMRPVRLAGDKSRPDLAEVTARFWSAYAKKHPQAVEPNRQPRVNTMRGRVK